tara:strand:- start:656 stop:817 length:162 start_codon:yes stop_codon:yes gene_type:complete
VRRVEFEKKLKIEGYLKKIRKIRKKYPSGGRTDGRFAARGSFFGQIQKAEKRT